MAKDPEAERARKRAYYLANKDIVLARSRASYEADREGRKRYIAEWKRANQDRVRASKRRSADANRESVREAKRRWKMENTDTVLAHCHKRRAALKAGGSYKPSEWRAVLDAYGHRCRHCASDEKMTVDHIIPISKGGRNTIDNLQPLCLSCNSKKWAKL